jgi:hypothetical protein
MPPQVAPPAPAAQPEAKTEPAPAAKHEQRRPPVAVPESPLPPAQPAHQAQPRGQQPKPAADQADDKKKGSDAQKLDEEERKQRP